MGQDHTGDTWPDVLRKQRGSREGLGDIKVWGAEGQQSLACSGHTADGPSASAKPMEVCSQRSPSRWALEEPNPSSGASGRTGVRGLNVGASCSLPTRGLWHIDQW